MNNIFTDNPDFYPTPREVIEKMMMDEYVCGKTMAQAKNHRGNLLFELNSLPLPHGRQRFAYVGTLSAAQGSVRALHYNRYRVR